MWHMISSTSFKLANLCDAWSFQQASSLWFGCFNVSWYLWNVSLDTHTCSLLQVMCLSLSNLTFFLSCNIFLCKVLSSLLQARSLSWQSWTHSFLWHLSFSLAIPLFFFLLLSFWTITNTFSLTSSLSFFLCCKVYCLLVLTMWFYIGYAL